MLTERPLRSGLQLGVASPIPPPFPWPLPKGWQRGKGPCGLLLGGARCGGQGDPRPRKPRAGGSQDTICGWQPASLVCIRGSVVGEVAEAMEWVPVFISPLEIL